MALTVHVNEPLNVYIVAFICLKFTSAAINYTEELHEIWTEKSRYVYTGRWSVFNDPNLDQSIIPDDEDKREGLRVGLLVSDWIYRKIGNSLVLGAQLDHAKLVTYYHTHHGNQSEPLLVCQPIQTISMLQFFFCDGYTKEDIDLFDNRGTFQYIWKFERGEFLPDIIILPLISLIGIFGIRFLSLYLFTLLYTWANFKVWLIV